MHFFPFWVKVGAVLRVMFGTLGLVLADLWYDKSPGVDRSICGVCVLGRWLLAEGSN